MIKLILVIFVFVFVKQSYEQEQNHVKKILEHQELGATESQEHRRENKRKNLKLLQKKYFKLH